MSLNLAPHRTLAVISIDRDQAMLDAWRWGMDTAHIAGMITTLFGEAVTEADVANRLPALRDAARLWAITERLAS